MSKEAEIEKLAFKELFPNWNNKDVLEHTELAMIKSFVLGYKAAQSNQSSYKSSLIEHKPTYDKILSLEAKIELITDLIKIDAPNERFLKYALIKNESELQQIKENLKLE